MSASVGEEVELRDLVMQVLESNGTLNKLKSQLRASVFLALENNSTLKSASAPKDDSKVETLMKSSEGFDVLALCRDLLSACNLTYSLSVFDSEIKHLLNENSLPTRADLLSRLGISHDLENIPSSAPLLSSIIALQRIQALAERYGVGSDQITAARRCFSRYESFGCITYEQLLSALAAAFPSVDRKVLQNYCADHYQDPATKAEANIDFEEFLTLYCYFLNVSSFSGGNDSGDDEPKSTSSQRKKKETTVLEPEIVEYHKIVKPSKAEGKQSPHEDHREDKKDDDPLDLLPKISPSKTSRRAHSDLFSIEKTLDSLNIEEEKKSESPAEKKVDKQPANDQHDNPDEVASFFNERPPWETEKDYADDFVADEDAAPQRSQVEDDCKVTEVSDEDDDVTMDETPTSEHRPSGDLELSANDNRQHSPTSTASDFTLNVDSNLSRSQYPNLANHPRLANVQFLEDVESTKF